MAEERKPYEVSIRGTISQPRIVSIKDLLQSNFLYELEVTPSQHLRTDDDLKTLLSIDIPMFVGRTHKMPITVYGVEDGQDEKVHATIGFSRDYMDETDSELLMVSISDYLRNVRQVKAVYRSIKV